MLQVRAVSSRRTSSPLPLDEGLLEVQLAVVAGPGAVALEQPRAGFLVEGEVEQPADRLDVLLAGEPHQHLDPTVEVAVHHVGRPDPGYGLAGALEPVDAAVLEEPAEHRAHLDGLRQAGYAGPDRADAAHQQLHRYAGLRGEVERVDHGLVDDRVGLEPDPGGPPGLVVVDLA